MSTRTISSIMGYTRKNMDSALRSVFGKDVDSVILDGPNHRFVVQVHNETDDEKIIGKLRGNSHFDEVGKSRSN